MHKILNSLFPFLCVLSLSACGVEFVDAEDSPPPAESADPDYRIEALGEPNRYQIRFREGIQARVVSKDQMKFESLPASYEGGETYRFDLRAEKKSNQVQITIPKDLVLDGERSPVAKEAFEFRTTGRLFLGREAMLTTMGEPLLLEASEIISEGARIQTFAPNARAKMGENGRDGGVITIKAGRVEGRLLIALRGEGGGQGLPGEAYQDRAYTGRSYLNRGYRFFSCGGYFRLGGEGGAGKEGRRGRMGKNGGNAGTIIWETGDLSSLKLDIENSPGAAGPGGDGGPGQPGGAGGYSTVDPNSPIDPNSGPPSVEVSKGTVESGRKSYGYDTPVPLPTFRDCGPDRGPDGPSGPKGETGFSGNPGFEGKVCRKSGERIECDRD